MKVSTLETLLRTSIEETYKELSHLFSNPKEVNYNEGIERPLKLSIADKLIAKIFLEFPHLREQGIALNLNSTNRKYIPRNKEQKKPFISDMAIHCPDNEEFNLIIAEFQFSKAGRKNTSKIIKTPIIEIVKEFETLKSFTLDDDFSSKFLVGYFIYLQPDGYHLIRFEDGLLLKDFSTFYSISASE